MSCSLSLFLFSLFSVVQGIFMVWTQQGWRARVEGYSVFLLRSVCVCVCIPKRVFVVEKEEETYAFYFYRPLNVYIHTDCRLFYR